MAPSMEEIVAGQKAYHRLKHLERNKPRRFVWVFLCLFFGCSIFKNLYDHEFVLAAVFGAIFALILLQSKIDKDRRKKDFDFLRELKTKYGVTIYNDVLREPSSLYYKFFQKDYGPHKRRFFIKLP